MRIQRGMDDVFGSVFCGLMLRELRGLISAYLIVVPRFDPQKCSKHVILSINGNQMVNGCSGEWHSYGWISAHADCKISDLLRPQWTVSLRSSSADWGARGLVGVAQISRVGVAQISSDFCMSNERRLWISGYGQLGPLNDINAIRHSSVGEWDTQFSSCINIDIRCEFNSSTNRWAMFARKDRSKWIIVYSQLENLGDFFPYVELMDSASSATFQPLLE